MVISLFLMSQDPWEQIAYLPDTSILVEGTGFSINDHGYIVGGMKLGAPPWAVKKSFWEYDPLTDTWEQLVDFPRFIACGVGFVIDSIAYITTGHDSSEFDAIDSLYAWHTESNKWLVVGPIPPGVQRSRGIGFSLNGKGYITSGLSLSDTDYLTDLWEYDPVTNIWTEKTSFPGNPRYDAICFTVGDCAYITLGTQLSPVGNCTDLWEYNAPTDTWAQKASFIDLCVTAPTAFSLENKGYITLGHTIDPPYQYFNAIWEYDPNLDQWQQLYMFPGMIRSNATSFVITNTGYIVGGTFFYLPINMDNWSFTPPPVMIDNKTIEMISIYPNPATSKITISTLERGVLYLNSINGQQVLKKEILDSKTTIDVSGLNRGIYIVKVVGEQGIQVNKVIKK